MVDHESTLIKYFYDRSYLNPRKKKREKEGISS
jgi:hypothetical protein